MSEPVVGFYNDVKIMLKELHQPTPEAKRAAEKKFPIQSEYGYGPHPITVPWCVAEKAFSVYRDRYGTNQSIERIAERGGFGPSEMDKFYPAWKEEVSALTDKDKVIEELREQVVNTLVALEEARGEVERLKKTAAEAANIHMSVVSLRAQAEKARDELVIGLAKAVRELTDIAEADSQPPDDLIQLIRELNTTLLARIDAKGEKS